MRRVLCCVAFLTSAGCAAEPPAADADAESSSAADGTPTEAWTVSVAQPDTADGIRILIVHDMEGLSGQTDPATYMFGSPVYARGQEMLARDLNAVIEGLYRGGATEVHIADGHGSGNPEPDVRPDLLDERARPILRDERFDTYFDLVEDDAYDAVAVVGMHAKTGAGGFASHTYTLGIDFLINGRSITETELVGLSWGRAGIPVIFASGDDRLAGNLETMPWIEYVTVKTAVRADSAVLRPVDEARADLTAGAERAVRRLRAGEVMAMRVGTPVFAALRAVPPASLDVLDGVPGITFQDGRVTFVADSLRPAYDGLVALVGVAAGNYDRLLFEAVNAHPQGDTIVSAFERSLWQRWFDVESGTWTEPAEEPAPAGRHHGYR